MDFRSNPLHVTMNFLCLFHLLSEDYSNHWSNRDSTLAEASESKRNVDSVLRWESIILDPIGPIIALTAFYVFQIFEEGIGFVVIILFILKLLCNFNRFWCAFLFNWLIGQDKIPQSLMPPIQLYLFF